MVIQFYDCYSEYDYYSDGLLLPGTTLCMEKSENRTDKHIDNKTTKSQLRIRLHFGVFHSDCLEEACYCDCSNRNLISEVLKTCVDYFFIATAIAAIAI